MQTIQRILQVTGCDGIWCGELGKAVASPEFAVGTCPVLRFDLRSSDKDNVTGRLLPLPVEHVRSDAYCFSLDSDYDQLTLPKVLTSDKIELHATEEYTFLDVEIPNTAVPALLQALEMAKRVPLKGEIAGYSGGQAGDVPADFVIQCEIFVRNRVYLPGYSEPPSEVINNPDYLTAAQVRALIAAALRPPKGDKGDPGQSAYALAVALGYKGTETEWLITLKGADGKDAYAVAVAAGYSGSRREWLESLRGDPGYTAYEVAVADGYRGTVSDWLTSLQGADGNDLNIDATGELSELYAYGDEKKGFVFAASVTDAAAKVTKLYLYAKRSDDYNDWCSPTVVTFYEQNAEVTALPPVEMSAGPALEYFSIDLAKYPYSTVAAVCIDTAEGEETLPYGSALGVRKIVKNMNSRLFIYFGSQCPKFDAGRVYLTQFLGTPSADGGGTLEGTMYYGFIPREVAGTAYRVTEITPAMLADSRSSVISADVALLGETGLGVVPEGALVVVLLPTDAKVKAEKFNGVGGFTTFYENNVTNGTGANGKGYLLDGEPYEIYGEFVLAPAEISIRITAKE